MVYVLIGVAALIAAVGRKVWQQIKWGQENVDG
jgi:hypothetical protein